MFRFLLLALLIIPGAEIYFMIKVGERIGAWPTVLLIVFGAVLGILLIKSQGIATLRRVQSTLARGEAPANAVLEGVILAIGGLLLLIPGFLTDALALFTFVPPIRRGLANWMIRRGTVARMSAGRPGPGPGPGFDPRQGPPRETGNIIEGEVIREKSPRNESRLHRDNRH